MGEPLDLITFQSVPITEDIVVGRAHNPLTGRLGNEEEVQPRVEWAGGHIK